MDVADELRLEPGAGVDPLHVDVDGRPDCGSGGARQTPARRITARFEARAPGTRARGTSQQSGRRAGTSRGVECGAVRGISHY